LDQLQHIVAKRKPYAQRNLLKALRGLMAFAKRNSLVASDPTLGIKPVRVKKGDGFYTWQEDDITRFEARHPIGSKARLAFALMLYTAAARSDAVQFGRQHIRGLMIEFKRQKTGIDICLPVHPELARIIAATPSGHLTFLVTEYGQPFTAAGFGNWMRDRCDEAGLPQCSSHGLRKAACRRLAEAGASVNQIAAVTGHQDIRQVEVYTRAADKKRMAKAAMALVTDAFTGSNGEQVLQNRSTRFCNTAKKGSNFKKGKQTWRPREDSNLRPSA
jgi:integrase